jgi:hypothetical protein
MEGPDVHYAHNGEIVLAYQVLGEGPVDLVFVPQWIGNLELTWDNPLYARFLNRLLVWIGRLVRRSASRTVASSRSRRRPRGVSRFGTATCGRHGTTTCS